MSRKKPRTPTEVLLHRLAERPEGTRCVLVLDPDRIIEFGRGLSDARGQTWEVVVYRGDDVVTRRAWTRVWGGERPVALVLSRPEGDESCLDASSIGDLVGRAEGDAVDLSTLGLFHNLFPRVNPPPQTLLEFRQAFLDNLQGFDKVYPAFKAKWGEPDSWSRGQLLALLLLARSDEWTLEDLWCNEEPALDFAAHAVGLLCHPAADPEALPMVAEVLWQAARHLRDHETCRWLSVPADDLEVFRNEVSAFLTLRDVLVPRSIAHLDTLLQTKLQLTTLDAEEVGALAPALLTMLKETGRWPHLQGQAQAFLTPARLEKVADLLRDDSGGLAAFAAAGEASPVLLAFVLRQTVLDRCRGKVAAWPTWLAGLNKHPLLGCFERGVPLQAAECACAALLSAAATLAWVEDALADPVPAFAGPEALLDWYTTHNRHLLEYRTAEAFARLEVVEDAELHELAYPFVMKHPDGLRHRVRRYLNELDAQLAAFVAADAQKFLRGPRSAVRILPDVVRGGGRAANRRVWLVVMDGMRYDTWDAVARPLLLEHFEVVDGQDRPFFSLLPSKTDIARRGLLAGALGKDWKNYFNKPTKDERILAARALGISKHEADARVLFVTDAETTEARAKIGYGTQEARDVNVLIYPISDDLGHHHSDTLAALNDKIRQQLLTRQGMRGVVDELRRRVQPGDLVLVTSDHGFQELFTEERVTISTGSAVQQGKGEEDIAYRYLKFVPGKNWSIGNHVVLAWEELAADGRKQLTMFTLPVGGTWYQRERGRSARYAHGGISLAEMAIPAVLLRPIAQKAARVELLGLPEEIAVAEGRTGILAFELINRGNVEAPFELTVTTNLGDRLVDRKGTLTAGKHESVSCTLTGRYETDLNRNPVPTGTLTAVNVRLSHEDLSGKMTHPAYGVAVVRVTVKPERTKVDSDALKAFDDV